MLKTAHQYLEEASQGDWAFINPRGCALRAVELALTDARRELHYQQLLATAIRNAKTPALNIRATTSA